MNPLWLFIGALAGYVLTMAGNPIRGSLWNGLRAVRRYPSLWMTLGMFGFGYAAFELAIRLYLFLVLPPGHGPSFVWMRSAYHSDWSWFAGLADSAWYLPPSALREIARAALLPALDSTAGLFNNLDSTFPISAFAGLCLLIDVSGRQAVLFRALRKRYGGCGWLAHGGILVCALAAVAKPALYLLPRYIDMELWYRWSPIVEWLSFLFEYLFGIYVQVYLILLAYCWVRGISFQRDRLLDFAIRRSSFVLRWAGIVILLSSLFLNAPLILKNFPLFNVWFPNEPATVDHRLFVARTVIDTVLILFATMQATLVFHSESLGKALRSHLLFLFRNAWPFSWILALSALHFYGLHLVDLLLRRGLGEGTILWVSWRLLLPWFAGVLGAWLLSTWVCVFRRCEGGHLHSEKWIEF